MPRRKWKVLVVTDNESHVGVLQLVAERDARRYESWLFAHARTTQAATAWLDSEKVDFVLIDLDLGDDDVSPNGLAGRFIMEVLKPRDVPFANFTINPDPDVHPDIRGRFVGDKGKMNCVVEELRRALEELRGESTTNEPLPAL